jgi:hypothetical protein|tara:strand:- start:1856 stop:2362 length:507 start_codon:yes stop_codon:yes gene_type:complete
MIDHSGNSGIISPFVSSDELMKWIDIMKQFDTTTFHQTVTDENIGVSRGVDENNKKGSVLFEHVIMKKIRQHFSEQAKLNFSHYVSAISPIKTHVDVWDKPTYISCLIPVSVDDDISLCDKSSTIVDNVEHIWKHGDLIWWDSTLPHCSNDFTLTNTSKQSIVIHTYV